MTVTVPSRSAPSPASVLGVTYATASALPTAITCTTQMRPSTGSAGGEESASVTVERVDALAAEDEELDLGACWFAASYTGEGPEGRSVVVTVTSPSGEMIVRDLQQYGDGAALRHEFVGGHGFTGLKYVDSQGAELQFSCVAEE